jgi:hypothetical protein
MSVSPRDFTEPRRLRARKSVTPARSRTTKTQKPAMSKESHPVDAAADAKFSRRSRRLPLLLKTLLWVQQGSSLVTFCLIGTVLASYAATVYLQQQWSEAYKTLENLQRETRNLTAADETFKHQLAKQAQSQESGLVFPSPNQTIYLSPSSDNFVKPPPQNEPVKNTSSSNVPLGY